MYTSFICLFEIKRERLSKLIRMGLVSSTQYPLILFLLRHRSTLRTLTFFEAVEHRWCCSNSSLPINPLFLSLLSHWFHSSNPIHHYPAAPSIHATFDGLDTTIPPRDQLWAADTTDCCLRRPRTTLPFLFSHSAR